MPDERLTGDAGPRERELIAPGGDRRLITRRRFLWYAGAAGAAAYSATLPGGTSVFTSPSGLRLNVKPLDVAFSTWLRRWQDQMSVRFDFINMQPMNGKLVPLVPGRPSYMAVRFWPQHLADRAFFETAGQLVDENGEPPRKDPKDPTSPVQGPEDPTGPPINARLADESRLAFIVDPAELNFTTEELLDWAQFQMSVVAAAQPRPASSEPPPPILIPGQSGSPGPDLLPGVAFDLSGQEAGADPLFIGAVSGVVERLTKPLKKVIPRPGRRPARPEDPGDHQTGIELPWHLVISPDQAGAWAHSRAPVDQGTGRYDLWHTRLARRITDPNDDVLTDDDGKPLPEGDDRDRVIRAVWDRDPGFASQLQQSCGPAPGSGPFRMSLDEADRYDITRLMSDFAIPKYVPQPAEVKRLMLSSLGGWLDSKADFVPPESEEDCSPDPKKYRSSLLQWVHRAALGRDAYVKTVRAGYKLPSRHPAVLVTITERKLAGNLEDPPQLGAYLRQRQFLVPLKLDVSYQGEGALSQKFEGRRFPFRHLRLNTLVTPNITKEKFVDLGPGTEERVFLIAVGGKPFGFSYTARDWAGRRVDFTAPAAFVSTDHANLVADLKEIVKAYNHFTEEWKRAELAGQAVALADSAKLGDTDLEIEELVLGAEVGSLDTPFEELRAARQPRFHPTMARARVRLSAAEQATNGSLGTTEVVYDGHPTNPEDEPSDTEPSYIRDGFDLTDNPGQVFVRTDGFTPQVKFGGNAGPTADRSGGVATPNLKVTGVSRMLGVIGGKPEDVRGGQIDYSTFFDESAVLLGAARLSDLLPLKGQASLEEAPRLLTERVGDEVTTKLSWRTTLKDGGNVKAAGSPLDLNARFVTNLADPTKSTYSVEGEATDLTMVLFPSTPFLTVPIDRIRFTSGKDRKPDVDVDVGVVVLGAELDFLNALAKYCSFAGAGGTSIEVLDDRIAARLGLELPSIAFGLFFLRNLAVSAALTIPFTGEPARVLFAFSEPQDKFQVLVGPFGGGGHVLLELGADMLEAVTASLEFGGGCSIDVGVASGSVEVMAGFEFRLQASDPKVKFTGYVRLGGELEVIGIISVSLTFYLELAYQNSPRQMAGQATMIVEVEVWPFSADVEVTVRRTFGNSDTPTFGDVLTQADWVNYCEAFAPIGA